MPNSAWTETGSSISLVSSTTSVASGAIESPNYLTNADKIALMAQYAAELATKTSLDTTASSLSISSSAYDSAVAAISTGLIAAGAPSNWATIWPDGTTSGPWTGIQTSLGNWWAAVATQRTALQTAIGAAQAAAAQAAAISTAAAAATADMTAAITAATNLAPAVVTSLPTLPNGLYPSGRLVWDSTNSQLYLSTGTAWVSQTVPAADISGTLAAAQIASLAASQITGTLTASQIAAVNAAVVSGSLASASVPAANISGTLSAAQIASLAASQITGTLTASQIASLTAAQITGTITGTQIASGTIATANLAAGSVTASQIAAGTIVASNIASGTITATQLAANSVTTTQIAAGTIQASDIASGTITSTQIAASTIQASNIAASTITGGLIAAGTITGSNMVAGTVTASQIAASTITAANIQAGTITTSQIAAGTIQASNIAANTITASQIAANTITAAQIAASTITATQIQTGTITAGLIAAGAIGATQIAAGAITTAALTVTDWTNLVYNPGFENGAVSWYLGSSSAVSATYANSGTSSLAIPTGQGLGVAASNGNQIPAQAGQSYQFQCWAYIPSALSSGGVYCRVLGLNGSGAQVQTVTSNSIGVGSTTGVWTLLSGTITLSSGLGIQSITFQIVDNSSVGTTVYVDDCSLRRMGDASLIVDGSITAAQIAAGAITASMITTGTLNAADVTVTNLNADSITTGTLDAAMVVFPDGSELTTAVSGTVWQQSSSANSTTTAPGVALPGLSGSVTAYTTADIYVLIISLTAEQTAGEGTAPFWVSLYIDGSLAQKAKANNTGLSDVELSTIAMFVTGLSAGSHTFTFYLMAQGTTVVESTTASAVLIQRMY